MKKIVLFVIILQGVFQLTGYAADKALVVSFGPHNAEPYAFIKARQLQGGIIKDIAEELGKELGIGISYKYLPRKRMEAEILSGKVHLRLVANPAWVKNPEQFQWSVPLFEESDRLVMSGGHVFPVQTFDDLAGKHVGTILGYYYPGLEKWFKSGRVYRKDVKNLAANFKKLSANRIDCLIDSGILIRYYLKKNQAYKQYILADMIINKHVIQGMFSKHLPIPMKRINAAFEKLVKDGKIQAILNRYK